MGLEWNVQPYALMKELRDNYTQTFVLATRKRSATIAMEATQWMKENAPWQDRPEDVRARRMEPKKDGGKSDIPPGTPHAREVLVAKIVLDREEIRNKNELFGNAARTDADALSDMNESIRDLREQTQKVAENYMKTDDPVLRRKGSRLAYNLRTQKQYQRRYTLPKGKSAVKRLEAEWKGMETPVVQVKFMYDDDRVNYSIWLEIANQGRYGIISKALDHWSPKLLSEIKQIANLVQYREMIAFGDVESPEQAFQQHVAMMQKDDPSYGPWTPQQQADRAARRKYYKPDVERTRRQAAKDFLTQEHDTSRGVRKVQQVETMKVNTYNRRLRR